jgi:uroporphyrin-3 C-methyltransferase
MTEPNQPVPPEKPVAPQETPLAEDSPAVETEPPSGGFYPKTALLLAVIALVIAIWQVFNARHDFSQQEKALTKRLEQFNANNQQSLALSKNADERSTDIAARISLLDQKLAESLDQQESLQTLYLELANNREERIVSEVEQLLTIANQQLQLAGNVKQALLALQTADTRLQQLDSPQVIQLRKAISQDIQRLQALPLIDIVGMSLKLENLAGIIDTLPLVSERHPSKPAITVAAAENSAWRRLLQEIWHDMKSMIRIERIDRPEPPLLAPEQDFFLRENIKLRILTARIALLQHDEDTYRSDLEATEQWLNNHFDTREGITQNALLTVKQLLANDIVLQIPDINDSLALVSKYKLSLERVNNARDNKSKASGAR